MKTSQSNIKVAIRIRPLLEKEINNKDFEVIKKDGNILHAFDPIEEQTKIIKKKNLEIYHRSRQQQYAFDYIFKKERIEQIYQNTTKKLI